MSRVYRVDLSTKNYPNNIFEFIIHYKSSYHGIIDPDVIKLSEESFTEDQMKGLNYILETKLTTREGEVIKERFQNKKTLKEIADTLGYSGIERPRQIIAKACRKLYLNYNLQYIVKGYDCVENELSETSLDTSIDHLQLTIRSYNCLKRASIKTIGDLKNIIEEHPENLLKVRNLGVKGLDEIYDKMKPFVSVVNNPEEESEITANSNISTLNLSPRTYNAISRYGIDTLSELMTIMYDPEKALNKIRNFGKKSYIEVGEKLVSLGLIEEELVTAVKAKTVEPKPEKPIEYTTEVLDKIDKYKQLLTSKIGNVPYPFNLLAYIGEFSDFKDDNRYRISDDKLLGLEFAVQTLDDIEQELIVSKFYLNETLRDFLIRTGYKYSDMKDVMEMALRKLRHPYRYTFIRDGFFGSHQGKNLTDINFIDVAELDKLMSIDPKLIDYLDVSFNDCTIGMLKDAIIASPKTWYRKKTMVYGLRNIGSYKNKKIIRYLVSNGILDESILENI